MTVELVILISPLPLQLVQYYIIITVMLTLLSELLFVVANSGVVEFATNESASLLAKISVGNELDGLIRSKRVKKTFTNILTII